MIIQAADVLKTIGYILNLIPQMKVAQIRFFFVVKDQTATENVKYEMGGIWIYVAFSCCVDAALWSTDLQSRCIIMTTIHCIRKYIAVLFLSSFYSFALIS